MNDGCGSKAFPTNAGAEFEPAGVYEFIVNAGALSDPSGVYEFIVSAGAEFVGTSDGHATVPVGVNV